MSANSLDRSPATSSGATYSGEPFIVMTEPEAEACLVLPASARRALRNISSVWFLRGGAHLEQGVGLWREHSRGTAWPRSTARVAGVGARLDRGSDG